MALTINIHQESDEKLNQSWFHHAVLMGAALCMGQPAWAQSPYPSMELRSLPQALQEHYQKAKPEMNDKSHCAAAFDSHTDGEKMVFRCSIHIKMSAEGERRAMRYCEESRKERKITAPCKLVVER